MTRRVMKFLAYDVECKRLPKYDNGVDAVRYTRADVYRNLATKVTPDNVIHHYGIWDYTGEKPELIKTVLNTLHPAYKFISLQPGERKKRRLPLGKDCSICKTYNPINEYKKGKSNNTRGRCKTCHKALANAYYRQTIHGEEGLVELVKQQLKEGTYEKAAVK